MWRTPLVSARMLGSRCGRVKVVTVAILAAPPHLPQEVRPIRINFDTLQAWCHPLSYYLGIALLRAASRQSLWLLGFQFHLVGAQGVGFHYYRPCSAVVDISMCVTSSK